MAVCLLKRRASLQKHDDEHGDRRQRDAADSLVLNFQPDSSQCEYFTYRRQEVLQHLQRWDADILVAGDSMMRQVSPLSSLSDYLVTLTSRTGRLVSFINLAFTISKDPIIRL